MFKLLDLFFGGEREIPDLSHITQRTLCSYCKGLGYYWMKIGYADYQEECPYCHGKGYLYKG